MKKKNCDGKHMALSTRIEIEKRLGNNDSIRKIALHTRKAHNTIAREIKSRRQTVKGNRFNNYNIECPKTQKSPYVCNGCSTKTGCRRTKYYYYAEDAHRDYKEILVNSRSGIDQTCDEFNSLRNIVKDAIAKGHSFAMIIMNHPELGICERTLYEYQSKGYLSVANIDLPRKVRYKKRKKTATAKVKRDPKLLDGRRYTDFKKYIQDNNITYHMEMDTVVGGEKCSNACLLTFVLKGLGTFLAYKLENKDTDCVGAKFRELKETLGYELFYRIWRILLCDRGSEFFDVDVIENNGEYIKESKLFFCDPYRSDQKGTLENTHEYVRRYIPKGTDFLVVSDTFTVVFTT